MSKPVVLGTVHLQMPWQTLDPFLFCVHHNDAYPAGDERMAPVASLGGRNIGSDFSGKDGWSMYHGDSVPGFPRHPHRGFETITIARRGFIDHSDSMGATARFGHGDCQWMTAGKGVVHSEMFPLVQREAGNHTELFQIWLNLPRADKMVDPYFTMLWSDAIPKLEVADPEGQKTLVMVYAGALAGAVAPEPPPNSWASRPESAIGIYTLQFEPGAHFNLPAAAPGVNRVIYVFRGQSVRVSGNKVSPGTGVQVRPDAVVSFDNGPTESEVLVLQGRPIGEPVVKHGPFVMNTTAEINQAIRDYRSTQFGGWPWRRDDPVHQRGDGRFAIHADGRREDPTV